MYIIGNLKLNETELSPLNILRKCPTAIQIILFLQFFLSLPVTRHDDCTDQIPILILHDHFVAVYCQIQLAP